MAASSLHKLSGTCLELLFQCRLRTFNFPVDGLGLVIVPLAHGRGSVGKHRQLWKASQLLGQFESACPRGTRRSARPICFASAASTARPVINISGARPSPTMRGSRTVQPLGVGPPNRRQNTPKAALSLETRISHHTAPDRQQPHALLPRQSQAWISGGG